MGRQIIAVTENAKETTD